MRIGEFQHASPDVIPTAIGKVLTGDAPGRLDKSEITVFGSSGISLQDLYVAKAILDRHSASTATG